MRRCLQALVLAACTPKPAATEPATTATGSELDRALAHRIMGWQELPSQAADLEANPYTVDEAKAIAATLERQYNALEALIESRRQRSS